MCLMLAIEAAGDSHVGGHRRNNEDSFAALPELGLFMVADGLGEIASILGRMRNLKEATAALIERANEMGCPDNVTCVLVRVGGH